MAEYSHVAIIRSCIKALPVNEMDETMLISLDAIQDHLDEMARWIRDAKPLVASGLRAPKVTTQEYARFLKTRAELLLKQ